MTYMRVTRDQRGYEITFLLHSPRPGERPRVLYWYRTAPGVRVGRPALDEDAIRAIEEQHPDIDFDWAQLLEEASAPPVDVERRQERPRRKPPRPREDAEASDEPPATPTPPAPEAAAPDAAAPASGVTASSPAAPARTPATAPANPLLEQLVGREIANRLRARHAEVAERIAELPASAARDGWQERADALDPDRWTTPEAILRGIDHADRLFDALKRELA